MVGRAAVPVSPNQSEQEMEVGYGRKVAFCVNPYTWGRGWERPPVPILCLSKLTFREVEGPVRVIQ